MVLNQFKIGVKEADFGLWVINVMFEGQLVYPPEAFPSNSVTCLQLRLIFGDLTSSSNQKIALCTIT